MWPENPKKHSVEIIVLALTLRIKCFSCNLIYPKSPRLKKRASRKHFEALVEKREPWGTFLSLGLQPRLQKPFPQFPFFYLGFKNLLLAALCFTLDNLGKIKLHLRKTFFLRVARTIIPTKCYLYPWEKDRKWFFSCGKKLSIAKKSFSIHFTSKYVLCFSLGQKLFCLGENIFYPGQK